MTITHLQNTCTAWIRNLGLYQDLQVTDIASKRRGISLLLNKHCKLSIIMSFVVTTVTFINVKLIITLFTNNYKILNGVHL